MFCKSVNGKCRYSMSTEGVSAWQFSLRLVMVSAVLAYIGIGSGCGQQNAAEYKRQNPAQLIEKGKLLVATCQFPISGDVSANAEWIRKQMRQAHAQQANIVHFPECSLSGFAGKDYENLKNFDWKKQRAEMESILELTDKLELWVVLGNTHQLSTGNKPHNCLYLINPQVQLFLYPALSFEGDISLCQLFLSALNLEMPKYLPDRPQNASYKINNKVILL